MIKKQKHNMISGNTVLAPEYESTSPFKQETYKELKKAQKKNIENKKRRSVKSKLTVLRNIMFLFVIGLTIVGRYCMIYNMQRSLANTKNQINIMEKENENKKVELVKFSNIQYVEEIAIKNLHMVRAERKIAFYSDLTKDNFGSPSKKEVDKKQNSVIEKIKNILF